MISYPTVLILGAGSSRDYGYPSGKELYEKVISDLEHDETKNTLEELGFRKKFTEKFKEDLFKSGKESVDAFLEYRQKYVNIGKILICKQIISQENQSTLYSANNNWYKYLFLKLDCPFEEFDKNNISIITFNYDRSIEHFLHTSLMSSYGKSYESCGLKLRKIKVIHVYGSVGFLPWQNKRSRPYEPKYDKDILLKSSESIKIVHENIIRTKEFNDAQKAIIKAKYIYFLGFGYYLKNLERLGFPNVNTTGKTVVGTAQGVGNQDRIAVAKYSENKIELDPNYDVLGFLKERAALI